jgi:nitrite reductase/ring-hydroxylating ferredoxin subunit
LERRVPHVGTYTRSLPVSLERLYENALDWEHLPWLHRSTFFSVELRDSGDWGWRAEVGLQPGEKGRSAVLELLLDRECRRWITRTLSGRGEGTEIWTHAFGVGNHRTDIVVDFFVPGTARANASSVRKFYQKLYTQLYDEDVSMMDERQRQLDRLKNKASRREQVLPLGRLEELRARLPLALQIGGDPFRIDELDGELVVYSLLCPHLLGPLGRGEVRAAVIECPWHGYRFDIRSGRSVVGRQACKLAEPPEVSIDPATREVTLRR